MTRLYPDRKNVRKLALSWMILSLFSMLSSTVYALLLIVTRSGLQSSDDSSFKTALVLHVTFSVLIWFFSIAGMVWSIFCGEQLMRTGWAALCLAFAGAFLLALTPIQGNNSPILNDYIPVLHQPIFYLALILFAGGMLIGALRVLLANDRIPGSNSYNPIAHAIKSSAVIVLCGVALIPIAWFTEYTQTPVNLQRLFWGSGHVLLLCHILIMLTAWFWLTATSSNFANSYHGIKFAISTVTLMALLSPLLYLSDFAGPGQYIWQSSFTWLMAASGIVAIYLVISTLVIWFKSSRVKRDWHHILVPASILFFTGNLLGMFIQENNALVPAHYHGIIGAITLSFMGLVYALLPGIGYRMPSRTKIFIQSVLYSSGLFVMILGLVISDVPRKAISKPVADSPYEVVGHIMVGIGGSMALLGSIVFLILVIHTLLSNYKTTTLTSELS